LGGSDLNGSGRSNSVSSIVSTSASIISSTSAS
jgi:hypothetical protein